jgi:hypothetical protein
MSIENLDKGIFPHPVFVPLARQKLMERDGIPIDRILKEVEERTIIKGFLKKGDSTSTKKIDKSNDIPIWS